jgi:hypothetical protein
MLNPPDITTLRENLCQIEERINYLRKKKYLTQELIESIEMREYHQAILDSTDDKIIMQLRELGDPEPLLLSVIE